VILRWSLQRQLPVLLGWSTALALLSSSSPASMGNRK
jgi:hypothetical protein